MKEPVKFDRERAILELSKLQADSGWLYLIGELKKNIADIEEQIFDPQVDPERAKELKIWRHSALQLINLPRELIKQYTQGPYKEIEFDPYDK